MSLICRTAIDSSKIAFRMVGGPSLSFGELEAQSCQIAHWFRSLDLDHGSHIAFMLENRCELMTLVWAAQRAGLVYTLIATHLKHEEVAYIAKDCAAELVVTCDRFGKMWGELKETGLPIAHWANVDPGHDGFCHLADEIADFPFTPLDDEREGSAMLYSSGTTGKPKGIKRLGKPTIFGQEAVGGIYLDCYGMGASTVYLSPAPLYHAAPLRCVMAVQRLGGTVIALERFTPEALLAAIEQYSVTHMQLVPTMMHRLLAVPEEERRRFDLSSLTFVVHAAAPCPAELKHAMINWLGPMISEYYGGTEGVGVTYITSEEWLAHEGSVGRAIIGDLHILDDDGAAMPTGMTGNVFFASGPKFEYYNAADKLARATNDRGWITLGDIGRLDDDGYLYLVDRKSFTINSGGVNIYPQEIEDILAQHAAVADAAVFGVPDPEFGEEVKAVVQLASSPANGHDAMEQDLIAYCRSRISHVKCPKSIDFLEKLPYSETGKLLKGALKERYWRDAKKNDD